MKDGETPEPGSLSEPGAHQAVSVLGIALIAMGEDIGAEMALRIFNHLVRGHHGQGKAVGESTVRESSRGGGGGGCCRGKHSEVVVMVWCLVAAALW